ncbi:hypothetical protein HD554DRAFT_1076864 [Boletus coccyginus]|nr:hypothetical protein HD554DRAFT_1076864 [Boletus coccyginus]
MLCSGYSMCRPTVRMCTRHSVLSAAALNASMYTSSCTFHESHVSTVMRATRATKGLRINSQSVTHAQFMHLRESSKPKGTSITCGNETARVKQTHRGFMPDGNQTLIYFLGHGGHLPSVCSDDGLNDLVYTSQDLECDIRITRELLTCAMMTLFPANAPSRELSTATLAFFGPFTIFSLRSNSLDASKTSTFWFEKPPSWREGVDDKSTHGDFLDDHVDQVLASSWVIESRPKYRSA